MPHLDIPYICTAIGDLAGMPVRVYDGEKPAFFHFLAPLPKDPILPYIDAILQIDRDVGYFVTDNLSYYGFVSSGKRKIILGPTRQIPNTDQELHDLAFRLDVPVDEVETFLAGMKSIVRMPFESILQILCVLHHTFTGEKLRLQDIQIFDAEQTALKTATEQQRTRQTYHPELADPETARTPHNTMAIEETLMNIVSHGDTAALREWLAAAPPVRGGTLAAEQLRQRKNMFIVTATLTSRAAIRGGLDAEEALSLSDQFIQSCELLSAPDRIVNLQFHMVREFAERVERIRLGGKPSHLTVQVANYIQRHLSEKISAEAMANELFLSRPYLSKKFVEETGETLTDFILKEKTEEAKRLLRYTDKTVTAISVYLGFSSLGHFSRVFKKYAGQTPHAYREKHAR